MGAAPASVIASADEALALVHAGLSYLAAADATAMGTAGRVRCLRELEQADAVATAARTSVLSVFAAGQDYTEDGDYSPFEWLVHRTRVTRGTAADHTGWVKRGAGHAAVMAALAARAVSKSYAREICRWTDKLPEGSRAAADEILLGAAAADLELADLARLAAEMYERSRQHKSDAGGNDGADGDDAGEGADAEFDDRSVTLATTFGGAGGLVPQRSGQPLRVWAYISLADLMQLEGSAELAAEWMSRLQAQWAGRRAAAAGNGGHQGLWLDGAAAQGIACGAPVTPVVVGNVNPAAFDDLIRLCAQLDRLLHASSEDQPAEHQPGADQPGEDDAADSDTDAAAEPTATAGSALSQAALVQAVIGKAAELLSGPGGLASFLRNQLGGRLGGPSLPLDIGYSETVPAHIRNAVRLRATHCEWAGGCNQPAAACQVHHTRHKAIGGETSLTGCVLLCAYHHQVMIHRKGWTLVVNPDGTTTAWNKDRTKVLHSHGPPARAG
jgi:hypothetical protein